MMSETRGLIKVIGPVMMIAMCVGLIVGPWIVPMSYWFSLTGPSIGLAYLVVAILLIPVVLCYGELTAMLPFAGGEINFAGHSIGKTAGFWVGWLMLFAYAMMYVMLIMMFAVICEYIFFPSGMPFVWTAAVATTVALAMAILTTFKVIFAARAQFIMFGIFLIVGIATALFFFLGGHYDINNAKPYFTTGLGGFGVAVGIMATGLVGFDVIPQLAEEANYPRKKHVKIMLISVFASAAIYILATSSVMGMASTGTIVDTEMVIPQFAMQYGGPALYYAVLIAAFAATLTTVVGFWLGSARVLVGLSRVGMIPAFFGNVNRWGQPAIANWTLFGLFAFCIGTMWTGWLEATWTVGAMCIGVIYFFSCVAFVVLRYKKPGWVRPWKAPWGVPLGIIGAICSAIIVYEASLGMVTAWWWGIIAAYLVVGLGIFAYVTLRSRKHPERYEMRLPLPEDAE